MNRQQRRAQFSKRELKRIERNAGLSIIVDNFHGVNWFEKVRVFPNFVVYFNPQDFPGKYVTRLFDGAVPLRLLTVKDTLEDARAAIPQGPPLGFHRVDRDTEDAPTIVEVWL